ncbi:hypothetical protein Goshw_010024, partial [Gossypium schwendimanii]|nr:hypothetical protein [Gossypium schwendimanii]
DTSWSTEEIIKVSYSWARQYVNTLKSPSHKSQHLLATFPLACNWICFNTDGSIKIEDDFAAARGIVRDSNGKWIFGFCRYLGCCTTLDAELWGILDEEPLGGPKSTLIRRIHQFLSKVHHWHIQHVPRDENKFADGLAKMVRDKSPGVRILQNPPFEKLV